MGLSILNKVLGLLEESGIQADVAYPGQRYPVINKTRITVHIAGVDSAKYTTTMEVTIHCPAYLGGTYCEETALRVLDALKRGGADCTQDGCQYDGIAKIYSVSIMAVFCSAIVELGEPKLDFSVWINGVQIPYAESFTAQKKKDHKLLYAMGENLPVGYHSADGVWEITLQQRYVDSMEEEPSHDEPFTLEFVSSIQKERYCDCRWTEVKREFSASGLMLTRKGFAGVREVMENE